MHQTLVTVAKDVKSQIEFNPQWVTEYRQIGYEKRQLRDEDFNNDKVDAGDIGAGKHVTLFFELTLNGQKASVDKLRYAQNKAASKTTKSSELAWLKLRWKAPQGSESTLAEFPVVMGKMPIFADASEDFRFRAAVAAFGQNCVAQKRWQIRHGRKLLNGVNRRAGKIDKAIARSLLNW